MGLTFTFTFTLLHYKIKSYSCSSLNLFFKIFGYLQIDSNLKDSCEYKIFDFPVKWCILVVLVFRRILTRKNPIINEKVLFLVNLLMTGLGIYVTKLSDCLMLLMDVP